jgi:hypothetical protein
VAGDDVKVLRRPPRLGNVLAPERNPLTGRHGLGFDRDRKHDEARRPRRSRRPRRWNPIAAGAGAGALAVAAVIGVVVAGGGSDDDAGTDTDVAASAIEASAPDAIAGPGQSGDASAGETSGSETSGGETVETSLPDVTEPPSPNLQASIVRTAFEEDPASPFNQGASVPSSLDLEVVCGPTKCLFQGLEGTNPVLFERDAAAVRVSQEHVTDKTLEEGLHCRWVADVSFDLVRQSNGVYTGTISHTSRGLKYSTTLGTCFDYSATWQVTMEPA